VAGHIVCYVQIHAEHGEKKPFKNKVLKNKSKQISEGKMTNQTTENFLNVMSTFKWPEIKTLSYRLYYNEDGSPKCYSMEELPGKYIEVDSETYALRPWNVRIEDQTLKIVSPAITVKRLAPNDSTGTCCDVRDICVVVPSDKPHTKWNLITNETY
jgi:hypothetical protein